LIFEKSMLANLYGNKNVYDKLQSMSFSEIAIILGYDENKRCSLIQKDASWKSTYLTYLTYPYLSIPI